MLGFQLRRLLKPGLLQLAAGSANVGIRPNGLESVIQAEPADVYETPRPENIAREMPPLGNPRNPHNSSVQNASRQEKVGPPPAPTPQDKVGRPDIKCRGCMSARKGLADSSRAFFPNPEKLAVP